MILLLFIDSGLERNMTNEKKIIPTFKKHPLHTLKNKADGKNNAKKSQLQRPRLTDNVITAKKARSLETVFPQPKNVTQKERIKAVPKRVTNSIDDTLKTNQNSQELSGQRTERCLSLSKTRNILAAHRKVNGSNTSLATNSYSVSPKKAGLNPHAEPNDKEKKLTLTKRSKTNNNGSICHVEEIGEGEHSANEMEKHNAAYNLARDIILQAELSQRDSSIKTDDKDESESIDHIKSGIGLARNEVQYQLIIHTRFGKADLVVNFDTRRIKEHVSFTESCFCNCC